MLQWTGWALLATSVVTVVTVGFGAITGNKVVTTTAMIGWVAVISQLLIYSKGLGSIREAVLGSALLNLAPGAVDGPAAAMSTGLALVVAAIWIVVFTAAGAWRTNTRDA